MSAKLTTLSQRFRRSLRHVGLLYTVQNVIKTCFPKRVCWANTSFIMEADLRKWPHQQAPQEGVRWATEEDGKLLEQSEMSEAEFHACLARGGQIAILEREGSLFCYFTYDSGIIRYYPWLRYCLAPDVIWNTRVWTAPQHRGKGIHILVRNFAAAELSSQGYVRTLASIDAVNIPSLRASIKKCAIVGSISCVRSFALTAVWVNGRITFGRWHERQPLELDSKLFHAVPNRPYGPVDAEHFERLIGKHS